MVHQIDCFNIHLFILKVVGIWPGDNSSRFYYFYSRIFLLINVLIFVGLYTINFYYLPPELAIIAEEMIFYFTDLTVVSKVHAFIMKRHIIIKIFDMLESDSFQSKNTEETAIIKKAKEDTVMYWKINAGISILANIGHLYAPLLAHFILGIDLEYPVCRYSFIPEEYKSSLLYPIYLYQSIAITSHLWYNVCLDTFLLGVMFLGIAQLDILCIKLRTVTDVCVDSNTDENIDELEIDRRAVIQINKCIQQYEKVIKYCKLIEDAFSDTIFVHFSLGSLKICFCLFRFTLPATVEYFTFLSSYCIVMILQIMVPCWFGSQLIERNSRIVFAVYNCDWIGRSRKFKSNLRLLVERANRPLSITGGKIFLLSLQTFTTIINSAYSFFTLLRHMQSR